MGQKPTAVPADHPIVDELDVLQHELGNVVHGVACVAGLLRDSVLDARQRRWLATIDRACGQIDAILQHARHNGAGATFTPRPERFNGVRLLEDALLAHAPAAAAGGIDLLLHLAPGLPVYWRSDPCLLRQMLDNLVGNALRYTRRGTVRVEAAAGRGDSGTLRLRVLDSGPGLGDSPRRLFEPGRRGAAARGDDAGSGLGLFVCRRIARSLGGRIRCRDRRAGGACFEVVAPGVLTTGDADWPPLPAFAGLECRLELDPPFAGVVAALLDRLGIRWRKAGAAASPDGRAGVQCRIGRPEPVAGAPVTGLVIAPRSGSSRGRPVHVPGPILESALESALYRVLLESRAGRSAP